MISKYQTKEFWNDNGFKIINPKFNTTESYGNIAFYAITDVERINFDVPLSPIAIFMLNKFHSEYPIEKWENFNEICDINERMKELF